jgi:hypothetical protein
MPERIAMAAPVGGLFFECRPYFAPVSQFESRNVLISFLSRFPNRLSEIKGFKLAIAARLVAFPGD